MDTLGAQERSGSRGNAREQRAKTITRMLIRRSREVGQLNIAEYAGISDSTVSRWFQENAEALGKALAFMDFKVLPSEVACLKSQAELDHLLHYARIGMASVRSSEDLLYQPGEDDPE